MAPSLFCKVLESKDLSKAGDLFAVDDSAIVEEFGEITGRIQAISSAPDFLNSHNDQSLVEICVTRIISAARETNSIQQHARSLVVLLQSCLAHNLRPGSRGDPPHAKMASDIMSCLFLNYNKKSVMQLAIPVAVKFLHKGNKDLSRNMSSYLSLAAIENADLLASHVQPILDSVISGNYSLSRVLPSIFSVDRHLIRNHVMTLVSILPNCGDSDSLALLTLFGLIAKDSPRLLESSIPQLCECLVHAATALSTVQVLQDIAAALPECLVDHLAAFKAAAANFPKTTVAVIQLATLVGLTSLERSRDILSYILEVMPGVEADKHGLVVKEVSMLTRRYPSLLTSQLVNKLEAVLTSSSRSAVQELRNEYNLARVDQRSLEKLAMEKKRLFKLKEGVAVTAPSSVTVVSVNNNSSEPSSAAREVQRGAEVTVLLQQQRSNSSATGFTVTTTSAAPYLITNSSYAPPSSHVISYSSASSSQLAVGPGTNPSASLLHTSGARVELTSVTRHERELAGFVPGGGFSAEPSAAAAERQLLPPSHLDRNLATMLAARGAASKIADSRSSTGRLATHRSMTRLNMQSSAQRLETRMLHKSMTRLDHRYNSNQTVSPPAVLLASSPTGGLGGRSVTSIASSSAAYLSPPPRPPQVAGIVGVSSPAAYYSASVPGAASPTKSMSSGSMSGLERDLAGREILTVSINQITSELARQSHQLSAVFSRPLPPDYVRDASLPPGSSSYQLNTPAPLSLPPLAARFGSYAANSGVAISPTSSALTFPTTVTTTTTTTSSLLPLSLLSATATNTAATSGSQPLDLHLRAASQDRLKSLPESTYQSHHHPRSTFSNTLPSLRRRSHNVTAKGGGGGDDGEIGGGDEGGMGVGGGGGNNNRMSVFEPFPMRDTVQHFCEKHLDKIKSYMESVSVKIPLPVKCTIEERKGRKHAKLHFACQGRGDHCLYKSTFYTMKSRYPRTWIHLMFLALQSRSQNALSTRDSGVSSLKNCWEILKCEEKSFSTLVTGAFPPAKDQDSVIHELSAHRFFDVFEYNGPKLQWGCFLCNHPERASTFLTEEEPVIEGQLKEKKGGKWKIFKKWKSRYFTLSGARLVYKETKEDGISQTLDVGSIRSVKAS